MRIHLSAAGLLLAACSLLRAHASEGDDFVAAFRADSGGDFSTASRLYHKVLQTKPNCDECHWNMALGTSRLGRSAEAQHHYREVVRIVDDPSLSSGPLQKTLKADHLGTALVSLGAQLDKKKQRHEAERLFTRALEVNPTNQNARDALRQLQAARSLADIPARPPTFPDAERVTLEQLEADPDLLSGRRAFVLVGATESWRGRTSWEDLGYFSGSDYIRDTTVDFYPFNLAHASRKPWLQPWRKIVVDGELARPEHLSITEQSPETNAAYDRKPYAQWRVPRDVWTTLGKDLLPDGWSAGDPTNDIGFLRTDPRVPDIYGSSHPDKSWLHSCIGGGEDSVSVKNTRLDNWWGQTRWRMLLVGEENSTMFLHQDDIATATWQWQAVGRKRWIICPPEAKADLYAASHMSPIDGFNADVAKYPLFAKANCSDIVANPGDVLYYPSHWFHQTLNLDPVTVGVAGRHINLHNYREVHTYFKKHCSTPQRRVPNAPPLEPTTCSRLDSCLVEWRKIWDPTAQRNSRSRKAASNPTQPSTKKTGLSVDDMVGRLKAQRESATRPAVDTSGTPSVSIREHLDSIGLERFAAAFEARDYRYVGAVTALAAVDLAELGDAIGMETGEILKLSRSLRKRARRAEL
eukprot:COSAG02_NODE_2092_length_9853_cov_12.323970_3_plen_636_part_00